jgi:hypothetical protein
VTLGDGQADEVAVGVDVIERPGRSGTAPQGPVEAIRPRVVRARQRRSSVRAPVLDERRATVPTGVQQRDDLAGGLSDDDDRNAGDRRGAVVARGTQLARQREQDRPPAKQDRHLLLEAGGVCVHGGVVEHAGRTV